MEVKLIGSFVFINQGYGILSSMYHNNNPKGSEPYPETAKKIKDFSPESSSDIFEGIYKTIWLEDGANDNTDLEIARQANETYKLRWLVGDKVYYYGIGFLRNNELIGSYWQL